MMGRGVYDLVTGGEEIGAGGTPLAGTHFTNVAAVRIHDEDLVAAPFRRCALEDDLGPVERPIGLGVLTPEGELTDVAKVDLPGVPEVVGPLGPKICCGNQDRHGERRMGQWHKNASNRL
jgi:hypothetical protein